MSTASPVIDSHTHAWSRWPYDDNVPDPATRGSAEHLLWEMDRHGVDEAVVVSAQIEHNPDNNSYVAQAVQASGGRLHQLADVDSVWSDTHHTAGAVERLERAVDRFRPVGLTHYVGETNDGWFRSDEGLAFFSAAHRHGLIASLAAGPAWQDDIRWLAERLPGLPIMIHHLGLVPATGPQRDEALAAVLASAAHPNVLIKLSGFHYITDRGSEYPHADARDVAERLYQSFGPHRLCWASDFPALTRYLTYTQSLDIVRLHCDFIAPEDLPLVMGQTMRAVLTASTRSEKSHS
jgi:L-fuconolactonase